MTQTTRYLTHARPTRYAKYPTQITVTALTPSTLLSPSDAQSEWSKVLHHLRRDGARPRDVRLSTPQTSSPHTTFLSPPTSTPTPTSATLMTTSLAHFRSDYTIIHLPQGKFTQPEVQGQLYANIGLLRMGCGGRSAVGLEECRFVPFAVCNAGLLLNPRIYHIATRQKTGSYRHITSLILH